MMSDVVLWTWGITFLNLEARERARAERGRDRDVGGVATACHQDAADARLVVAGVERVGLLFRAQVNPIG
jgi:hypothetical protein